MPIVQPSFKPQITTGARNIVITETTSSFGEATISLPDSTKQLIIRARTLDVLKISTVSNGEYFTLAAGCSITIDNIELTSAEIFIKSSAASVVIEAIITYG